MTILCGRTTIFGGIGKIQGFLDSLRSLGMTPVWVSICFGAGGCWDLFPLFGGDGFGGGEGLEEGFVFLFGEGAVDVVGGAFVPARGEVDLVHVDGGGVDDGGDGVVEGEMAGAGDALELLNEGRVR